MTIISCKECHWTGTFADIADVAESSNPKSFREWMVCPECGVPESFYYNLQKEKNEWRLLNGDYYD